MAIDWDKIMKKAKEQDARSNSRTGGGRSPGGQGPSGRTGMEMVHAVLDRGPYRRGMAPSERLRNGLPDSLSPEPRAFGRTGYAPIEPEGGRPVFKQPTFWDRLSNIGTAGLKGSAGNFVSSGGAVMSVTGGGTMSTEVYKEQAEAIKARIGLIEEQLEAGRHYNPKTRQYDGEPMTEADIEDFEYSLKMFQDQLAIYDTAYRANRDIGGRLYEEGGKIQQSSQADAERAKQGLGKFGTTLVDAGIAGVQMAGDFAVSALTGGTVNPLTVASGRVFGRSAQAAKDNGATDEEAALRGILSAVTTYGISKLSSVSGVSKAFSGKGATTEWTEKMARSLAEKLGKTAAGKTAVYQVGKLLASGAGEAVEEMLEDVADPILDAVTYRGADALRDYADPEYYAGMLYDGLIGGIMGLTGGGLDVVNTGRVYAGYKGSAEVQGGGLAAPETEIPPTETASTGEAIQADTSKFDKGILTNLSHARTYFIEYAKSHFPAFVKNSETGNTIGISRKGIDKFLSGNIGYAKYASGFHIPELIENAHLINSAQNYHSEKAGSIPTFEYYNSPVQIDGVQYTAHIRVKNTNMGDKYYGHTISEIESIEIEPPARTSVPVDPAVQPVNAIGGSNVEAQHPAPDDAANAVPRMYVQDVRDDASNNIIPQSSEKSNSELPPGTGAMDNPFIPTQERSAQKADAVDRQMPFHSRQSIMKDIIPEAESMRRAEMRIETDIEGEMEYLRSKAAWTGEDVDLAMLIKEKLGLDAIESGKYGAYRKWYKEVVGKQKSEAGRTLQAIQKWTRDGKQSAIELVDNAAEILEKNSAMSEAEINAALGEAAVYALTAESQFADGNKEGLIDTLSKVATERGYKPSNKLIKALNKTNIDGIYDALWKSVEGLAFDQIPRSFGSKLSTYQYLSHLLNAKTLERNIIANAVFAPLEHHINNLAIIPDTIVSAVLAPIHHTKVGKMRSVGWEPSMFSKAGREGIANATRDSYVDIALDINRGGQGDKYQTSTNRVFKRKPGGLNVLNRAEGALGYGLNWTDAIQKGNTQGIAGAANQSLVNKGGRVTPELAERFTQDSMLTRSFQRETLIGNIAQAGKDWLNVVGIGTDNGKVVGAGKVRFKVKDFGLGDLVQKYTRVMGSLATSAAEYTPLGYAKALYNLGVVVYANTKSAKGYGDSNANMLGQFAEMTYDEAAAFAQRNFAISVTRPIVGLGLASACGALFKLGLLLLSDDDEYDKESMMSTVQNKSGMQMNLSALGRLIDGESTAIQEDDVLINLDFLEPVNSIMRLGITMQTADDQSFNTQLEKSAEAVFGSVTSMPMMQNVKSVINTIKYRDKGGDDEKGDSIWDTANEAAAGLVGNSASGFIPGPIRHAAQAADNTVRDISDPDRPWMQVWNRLLSGVPGARNTLPEKLDSFGSPRKYTESGLLNALNATVIPGAAVQYRKDLVAEELERHDIPSLYPDRKAPNSISNDGEKYRLSSEQKRTYQTLRGRLEKDILDAMTSGAAYKGLSDEGKAEVISKAQGYAREFAKLEVLKEMGIEGEAGDTYRKAFEAVDKGMEPEDYFVYKQTEGRYDADGNGELNTGELARSIEKSGLSGQAKSILWAINFPDWPQEAKELGVGFDVYTQYKAKTYGLSADKDEDGKSIGGTKKAKVLKVIDGLDLTVEQKDALYLKEGYAESTLWEAPWHRR